MKETEKAMINTGRTKQEVSVCIQTVCLCVCVCTPTPVLCSAKDGPQGSVHSGQAFCQLSYIPGIIIFLYVFLIIYLY